MRLAICGMKTKIGEITMKSDLLRERPRRAEGTAVRVARQSTPAGRPRSVAAGGGGADA